MELAVKVLKSLKGLVKEFFMQIDIISHKNIMALVWFCIVLHQVIASLCVIAFEFYKLRISEFAT
jgi:hypothetical protein